MRRRVVITGMGTVNPVGHNVDELWDSIVNGKSGIASVTRFDSAEFASKIVGEVKDFNASDFIDKKTARKMAMFTQYAVVSADQALRQAGLLEEGSFDPYRAGVILGNGIGGFEIVEEGMRALLANGPNRISPMTIPKLIMNEGPGNIAIYFGLKGPCYTIATACASGTAYA